MTLLSQGEFKLKLSNRGPGISPYLNLQLGIELSSRSQNQHEGARKQMPIYSRWCIAM
ncbi:hypothetical protein SVIOM342S_03862 [Streptomyces violaceorubidus]